jgi:hypothetical protein
LKRRSRTVPERMTSPLCTFTSTSLASRSG